MADRIIKLHEIDSEGNSTGTNYPVSISEAIKMKDNSTLQDSYDSIISELNSYNVTFSNNVKNLSISSTPAEIVAAMPNWDLIKVKIMDGAIPKFFVNDSGFVTELISSISYNETLSELSLAWNNSNADGKFIMNSITIYLPLDVDSWAVKSRISNEVTSNNDSKTPIFWVDTETGQLNIDYMEKSYWPITLSETWDPNNEDIDVSGNVIRSEFGRYFVFVDSNGVESTVGTVSTVGYKLKGDVDTSYDDIFNSDGVIFTYCTKIKDVSFPVGLISVYKESLLNCSGLIKLSLSKSIKSTEMNALKGCVSLTNILWSDIDLIGDGTFDSCSNLTSITLSGSRYIGRYAFSECAKITSISLDSAIYINENVFNGCPLLEMITIGTALIDSSIIPNISNDAFGDLDLSNVDLIVGYGDVTSNSWTPTLGQTFTGFKSVTKQI